MATAASGLERHHIQALFTGSAGCRDQCNQHEVPSSLGDDNSVDDTVVDNSCVEVTVDNLDPPPSPTRETQLDPCRSESKCRRQPSSVDCCGRHTWPGPPSGTRRFFSGCSARNVARRVVTWC